MTDPWLKFYPSDWRSDPMLRICSIAARGLWIEMLCLMHEANGFLRVNGKALTNRQIAALAGGSLDEVAPLISELEEAGVFSRDEDGTIYSRRMCKDAANAERDRALGLKGGNPLIRRGTVPKEERARPFKRSDNPAKTRRIFNRSGGACHWCKAGILYDDFHVDHVVAICDGGTNDEENLVAACAACNHARARVGWSDPNFPDHNPDSNPDSKAQKPESRSQKPEARVQKPEPESEPELEPLSKPIESVVDVVGQHQHWFFEYGPIRLTEDRFHELERSFPNLPNLRGDITALASWAASKSDPEQALVNGLQRRNDGPPRHRPNGSGRKIVPV